MRVLFTCVPQAGHITPLLPLASAFVELGDEVLFATGADAADAVSARGCGFSSTGPPLADWMDRLRSRIRGLPGDGLPPANVERYFLPRLFGEIGAALMVDDLLRTARGWRPNLLVFEPFTYAAPLVAAVAEIPGVLHTIGALTEPTVLDLVTDAVSPLWREFGHDVPQDAGLFGGATIAICPPSLDPPSAQLANVLSMRPTDLPRDGARPADVPPQLWQQPVVYLTLGTFSNTNLDLFRLVIEAVGELPISLVVTVGRDNESSALGSVPANVYVTQFIPQADLLPHCAGVVHHAGAGTAFGVLAHGLPSVALPQSADNFVIAERLGSAMAAEVLMPGEVSIASVRDAVGRVIGEPKARTAAEQLAAEIAAMGSPDEVARALRVV